MKDASTERLASFAHDLRFEQIPGPVLDLVERHLLDALACLFGGFDSPPASAIRQVSPTVAAAGDAGLVVGQPGHLLSFADASRLNTVRARYLDHNDTFPGGHPSDMLGAIWAASRGRSARDVVVSAVVGYEVFNRLCAVANLRERGWDQGSMLGLATAAALARLRGASRQQCADALAITAVSTVHLRATRTGALSAWKGCATGQAVASAVTAVQFAEAGIDGPSGALDGRHGLAELVTGPLDWPPFPTEGGDYWCLRTGLKFWPVEYGLQPAVWLARRCREVVPIDEVESVTVTATPTTTAETGSPDRWRPTSREAADHSLPYVFARTLATGSIGASAFVASALEDEDVIDLMDRVSVRADPQLATNHAEVPTMRCTVHRRGGAVHHLAEFAPLGYPSNPMTAEHVADKYRTLARRLLPADAIERHLATWRGFVDLEDVGAAIEALVVPPPTM